MLQRHCCMKLQVEWGFLPGDINDGGAWLRHRQHGEFEDVLGMGGVGGCGVVVRKDVLVAHVLPPRLLVDFCSFSTVARRPAVAGLLGLRPRQRDRRPEEMFL